jgi:outer membrane protein assembly factor BamE (lipoprotein component of BamABCDE complex)
MAATLMRFAARRKGLAKQGASRFPGSVRRSRSWTPDRQERSVNRRNRRAAALALIPLLATLGACESARDHRAAVRDDAGERVTVGTVQREIRVGMSGAEVAQALGSPNVVTSDDGRRETWIYDKIATERAYSTSYGSVMALVLAGFTPGNGIAGGGVLPGYGRSAGASSTSQRTLTVIIKFDENRRVRDFAYHESRF